MWALPLAVTLSDDTSLPACVTLTKKLLLFHLHCSEHILQKDKTKYFYMQSELTLKGLFVSLIAVNLSAQLKMF